MAKKARSGSRIGKYEILAVLNSGAMAIAYAAKANSKEKVFFKQYKSPTTTVSWYEDYVEYQGELKRRIESTTAKNFSYRFIEFFEEDFGGKTYFQVFEFVEGGHDLEAVLERARQNPKSITWEQRLTFAKVMMAGINAIHEAGIIHCDLKPANIQLFKDPTITAGYRLKVIDMDFSILKDRRAPWHGVEGYVGTPMYYSPEHLANEVPKFESDVFTCGLILYELLAGQHPYRFDDPADYAKAAINCHALSPTLLGAMTNGASDKQVAEALHRCLSPHPEHRPTAKEVNQALNGRLASGFTSRPAFKPDVSPGRWPLKSESERIPAPIPIVSTPSTTHPLTVIELVSSDGGSIRCGIRTEVGKHLCTPLGDDSKFFAAHQFMLDRDPSGQWFAIPNLTATNQTMHNGNALKTTTKLNAGDVLGVGNEAKGVVKLPLTVRFS